MASKHINRLQNCLIFALALSAILLFVQTQLYSLGESPRTLWESLRTSSVQESWLQSASAADLSAPVGVAVTSSFGRTGSPQFDTQTDAFIPLGTILGEALRAVDTVETITQRTFQAGLSHPSIYYEFYVPLPASIIAQGLLGAAPSPLNSMMRRLILVQEESGDITLRWWDGDEGYFSCDTSVSQVALRALLEGDLEHDVFFAFEGKHLSQGMDNLDPLSLFFAGESPYPTFTVTNPLDDTAALLSTLGFNPHTNYRYAESSGTEVVMEDERSVRIHPNGTVEYRNDEAPTTNNTSQLTAVDAVLEAGQLLHGLITSQESDGALFLQSITQELTHPGETTLTFDYYVQGVPILRANGEPSATVVLQGNTIVALSLRLRQYAPTESATLLLPLTQAAAAAETGCHMRLLYVDGGEETIPASWVSTTGGTK